MEDFSCTEHTVLKNGHVVKKVKGLKNHAHLGPVIIDLLLDCSDLFSMVTDLSAGLCFQLVDAAKQGGFSGTGRTYDTDDLARLHVEINFSQHLMLPKRFA